MMYKSIHHDPLVMETFNTESTAKEAFKYRAALSRAMGYDVVENDDGSITLFDSAGELGVYYTTHDE